MTALAHASPELGAGFTKGSTVARRAALGALYGARLGLLGAGTTAVFPLGDPDHGLLSATTFKTTGALAATVTPSEPIAGWDTKAGVKGVVPVVRVNGTDEEADTPDNAFFERGDGSAGGDLAMSVVAIVRLDTVTSHVDTVLQKHPSSGALEWRFFFNNGKPNLRLTDDSAGVDVVREADAAIAAETWTHVAITRPAAGTGASAMDDAKVYVNGELVASTATNSASYAGMEPLAGKVDILFNSSASTFFKGYVAGGPAGPTFCQIELTAAQVRADYELARKALNL